MPSISSGFWVARTKNGASSGKRWRATVTWCSCIASRRLDWVFGRRPVDLVGEDEVGEDRARLEAEDALAALLDEDVRAGDVCRHQVRRELDPVEGAVDDVADGPHEHRLAEPRDALEQDVAVGEQAGQRLADERGLADDDPADLALDGLGAFGERLGGESGGGLIGVLDAFIRCLRAVNAMGRARRSSRARSP